ncbi:hypothetical protein C0J52_23737 [Blattella germanica]|nr:hypothetical protein C0J52_23737 [Blattella germanica]
MAAGNDRPPRYLLSPYNRPSEHASSISSLYGHAAINAMAMKFSIPPPNQNMLHKLI